MSVANRIAQPLTPGYVDTTAPGSYFYKVTAEDAAGNISAVSNEAAATVLADTTAPSQPVGLAGSVVGSTVNLSWTVSSDNVGVTRYNVHRGTSAGFTPSAGNRIAQPTVASYADTGLATGSYFYKVTAEDAAGNISAASNEATATVADATPPTAPSSLAASVAGSTVNLSWVAATDNVGVSRYNLHRSTTSGFTPSAANRIAQPTGLSYADTNVSPGSYFYKLTAEDAAGNLSPVSNTASASVLDTSPPSTPTNLAATGGAGQASLTWTAATDNVAVSRYNLHRGTTSGFTPSAANRIAQPTTTSYTDTGLAAGTYFYKLTAEDAAANISGASNEATATVSAPPVTGLVAAYGFDTGSGTTTPDQSGTGNNGTLSNATWTTTSKYGQALAFNGTNASVTIPDTNSLDLTTGMTLEAWVHPTALGSNWSTAILKEATGSLSYGLYANGGDTGTKVPTGEIVNGGFRLAPGTTPLALNTWSHLATTYDGTTLRLFVNGVQAGQLAIAGAITTSTGAAEDRRQLDLGRMVPRRNRRSPHLQPRPQRHRTHRRHEHLDQRTRLAGTERTRDPHRNRRARAGRTQLGRRDRQRWRRPLQRPPRHERRLHALRRQPDRAADRHELQRLGSCSRHLLLQGHRRGLRGQRRPRRERGDCGLRGRHDTADGVDHGAGAARHGQRHDLDQRQRVRQRHGRRRAVQARRREPRRRGHHGSLLLLLGHVLGRERPAHPGRGRTRRRRQHDGRDERRRHGLEHRLARPGRRLVVRRGRAGRRRPTSPATETSARSAMRPA